MRSQPSALPFWIQGWTLHSGICVRGVLESLRLGLVFLSNIENNPTQAYPGWASFLSWASLTRMRKICLFRLSKRERTWHQLRWDMPSSKQGHLGKSKIKLLQLSWEGVDVRPSAFGRVNFCPLPLDLSEFGNLVCRLFFWPSPPSSICAPNQIVGIWIRPSPAME